MKTAKLIIGIVSIVVFVIVMFQSCATGVVNALESNATDASGGGGAVLGIIMLIAGIVGIATRNSKGGGITAGIFYLIGALIGFASLGTYGDLVVWSVISLIFAIVFIVGSVTMKNQTKL
ncbi:MAG: hypothetical protein LBN12_06395 [Clostridiales Family XIII bacterium]|nr:hypothetical protein [Clostridiales Family XIII bacterium]